MSGKGRLQRNKAFVSLFTNQRRSHGVPSLRCSQPPEPLPGVLYTIWAEFSETPALLFEVMSTVFMLRVRHFRLKASSPASISVDRLDCRLCLSAQVRVWLCGMDHYYVLSRYLISRTLTVTKIPYVKVRLMHNIFESATTLSVLARHCCCRCNPLSSSITV